MQAPGAAAGGDARSTARSPAQQSKFRPDWYYEVGCVCTPLTLEHCAALVAAVPCLQYELRGIVAHVGTADSGHYYSFIREREPKAGSGHAEGWFEFNDRIVTPFNVDKIAEECYGGCYTVDVRVYTVVQEPVVMC